MTSTLFIFLPSSLLGPTQKWGGRGSERMTGAGPSVELNCNNSPARWSQLCTFGAGAMRQYATTNIKEYSVYAGLLVNEH